MSATDPGDREGVVADPRINPDQLDKGPVRVTPLVSRQGGTAWKAGDPCHACGSTDTGWVRDGVLIQAHCNGCGRDDWDDD